MAFLFKFVNVFFLVVLCFLAVVLQQSSDYSTKVGCLYSNTASQHIHNRKVLYGMEEEKKVVFKKGANGKGRGNIGKKNVEWGVLLRETPLGPDPLHHHGGTPNKPRTDP